MQTTKRWTLLLMLTAGACLGGCSGLRWLSYVLVGDSSTRKVKAEFTELRGKKVAVVIQADERVYFEHTQVDLEMGYAIRGHLLKNVNDIRVVDPPVVSSYQERDLRWEALPKTELGKELKVDYVLLVTIAEFSTQEPGTVRLFRGNLLGSAALYKTNAEEDVSCVWYTRNPIRVTFPKESQGRYGQNDRKVRLQTINLFADELAKKFYDHEIEVTPEG